MLWDLFCVIVVCHKNPFLEYRAARGLLSNASPGTVTLFLKPYSVSVPLIQSDSVASLPGTLLTYVCSCGTVITVLHLLTFPKCLFGMKIKAYDHPTFTTMDIALPQQGLCIITQYWSLNSFRSQILLWQIPQDVPLALAPVDGIPSIPSSDLVSRYNGRCPCNPILSDLLVCRLTVMPYQGIPRHEVRVKQNGTAPGSGCNGKGMVCFLFCPIIVLVKLLTSALWIQGLVWPAR